MKMATFSLILGIISVVMCWVPTYGVIIALVAVAVTAVLKRKKEYDSDKRATKSIALIIAIVGLIVAMFITGLKLSRDTIVGKTNDEVLNDVRGSLDAANLLQAQQQATYAWNQARMRGLKGENMEQYIFNALKNFGIDTTNLALEITKTGATVKVK
jgi:hypothetical protein